MNSLQFIYPGFLNLGPTEIILILLVAVLLFGGKLPEVARTLGKQFFDMKRNLRDLQNDIYRQDVIPPRAIPKPYYRDSSAKENSETEATPILDAPQKNAEEETGKEAKKQEAKKQEEGPTKSDQEP
ncbi:MAG: twin-arginine translocase TatA/TatE family subunit [Planctomycetota bacterium]